MNTLYADIQKRCKCGEAFWVTAAEQQNLAQTKGPVPDSCPTCRCSGLVSARLPAAVEKELTGHLIKRREALVADLGQLMAQAFAPIEERKRTFLEWLNGVDLHTRQLEQKYQATASANTLVIQRTSLVQNLRSMVLAMGQLEQVELDVQLKILQGRIALQQLEVEERKLEAEALKVEEEIAERQALRDERLKTQKLEENRKQTRLLSEINPPPQSPEPVETEEERTQKTVTARLEEFQTRLRIRQELIGNFTKELRRVYDADCEDTEKALRIRAVIETYRQDIEAVPREIRDFLDWVENDRGEKGQ